MKRKISTARYTIMNNPKGVITFLKKNGVDTSAITNSRESEDAKVDAVLSLLDQIIKENPEAKAEFIRLHPDYKVMMSMVIKETPKEDITEEVPAEEVKDALGQESFYEQHKDLIKGGLMAIGGLFVLKFIIGASK